MTRIALTVDAETEAAIESRRRPEQDGRDRSEIVRRMISRYDELCRRDRPDFSEAEWNVIRAANNGTWLLDSWSPTLIWANVADTDPQAIPDGVDQTALAAKLRALTYGQAVAVVDAVERFWARA